MDVHHDYADLGEVTLHYVTAGEGYPVVLLHGFPQTWYEWREIIPRLAGRYRVIAPDLRGLGDSTRPAGGYDKATVAGDVWRLVHDELGHARFHLVGHDWGGPTAYALAAAHRDAISRLVVIDVTIPGDGTDSFASSQGRWHHLFHRTLDLPEALIAGRERIYYTWFYRNFGHRPDAVPDAAIEEYLRTYTQPGALRAGLAYYRATPQDVADNQAAIAAGKLTMPVLGLGGAESFGRRMLTCESMQRVAEKVEGGVIEGAGHWIPEEQPEVLAERLLSFFGQEGD